MYKDGLQKITNIDISATVIKQMQERYKEDFPLMKCNPICLASNSPSYGCKKVGLFF
jgi:hypothetical protein